MPNQNDPFQVENIKSNVNITTVKNIFSNAIDLMILFAGIAAIFALVWSGVQYLTALGNEEKIAQAKKTFLYALAGLIVVLSTFYILSLIQKIKL